MSKLRFSQMLLQDNLVTEEQLQGALRTQAQSGGLLGSILYSRGLLTEEQVITYLSQLYEVPAVAVSQVFPTPKEREALIQKIPYEIALKHQILPIKLEGKLLTIASVNTQDFRMIQEVEFMTGCRLKVMIAMQAALKDRMAIFYGKADAAISLSTGSGNMVVTSLADDEAVEDALITRDPMVAISQIPKPVPSVPPDWKEIQKRATTVLVVDDDPNIRNLLQDSLTAKNYNVLLASRGREAVQKIQATRPDLILLDAMLPEVHGFTICKTLKESEKYRTIPVIIMSAVFTGWRFMMDVKDNYGADEVIEKPFKMSDLLAAIKRVLDVSESRPGNLGAKDLELSRKAEECLEIGAKAFKAGKIEEAAASFRKGIEIDQTHPILHYYLGKCAEAANETFTAIASLERAIELDPYLFPAVKDLGILYQKNGFKRKAIEMWERAVQVCQDPAMKEKIKQNLMRLL